jgi:hypothetical protein
MARLLTRLVGLLLLAGGFIALVADGTRSIAGGGLLVTSLGAGLAESFPAAWRGLESAISARSAFLWDPVATTLAMAPVSLTLGGVGAALLVATDARARGSRSWRR